MRGNNQGNFNHNKLGVTVGLDSGNPFQGPFTLRGPRICIISS